ncbi:hypothetical protein MLD52_11255 [Puniceicoccaceae bacterium K14]|nr:hypothetical protein [Puniceicoccaceae bacterium K14]
MKESLQREKCFAYLLGDLGKEDMLRFEGRLDKEEALSTELRKCSNDLADFADEASDDLRPSAYVWAGVEEKLFGEQNDDPILVVWWRRSPFWLVAACILMLLNLSLSIWQLNNRNNSSVVATESNNSIKERISPRVSQSVLNTGILASEIETMNERLVELKEQLVVQYQLREVEQIRVRELEEDRRVLAAQMDSLERDYLEIVGIRSRSISEETEDSEVEEDVIEEGSSPKILIGSDSSNTGQAVAANDIWERLKHALPEAGLAILDFQKTILVEVENSANPNRDEEGYTLNANDYNGEGLVFGINDLPVRYALPPVPGTDVSIPQPVYEEEVVPVPYVVSLINDDSSQAVLSLGNLPELAEGEEFRIWNRPEGMDSFIDLGAIGEINDNSNLNVAIRLPEEDMLGEDFMVSIEAKDQEIEQPSQIIIRP